jgi:hypothetical protein
MGKRRDQETNTTCEAWSKDTITEERKFPKEGHIDRKQGRCPSVEIKIKGGHNNIGNPVENYSTRDRTTQMTNHTYRWAAQKG